MDNKSLVSVIVPIYNVEKYLARCVDSIINQTYKNLEIILVDDGSTDKSSEICDLYANSDNRIKVMHLPNGGAGKARNIALNFVHGSYVAFVDSDDYLEDTAYEKLMNVFFDDCDIDIAEFDYCNCYDDNAFLESHTRDFKVHYYNTEEAMYEHLIERNFKQVIWNKIYNRNVIKNIRFPENRSIDDEYWTYKVITNAKKLARIDEKLYAYRQRDLSITHSMKVSDMIESMNAKYIRHLFILEKFPEYSNLSAYSVWCISMYQSQNIRKFSSKMYNEVKKQILFYVKNCKIVISNINDINLKQRFWLFCSNLSWDFTVKLRNLLGIGM